MTFYLVSSCFVSPEGVCLNFEEHYCWEIISEGPIERWISVDDGAYFNQYGYLSVSVPEKEHEILVQDYGLQYIFDGTNYYDNPDTIMVTSDMTIVAYYFWQG
jgi:hypothetical protein